MAEKKKEDEKKRKKKKLHAENEGQVYNVEPAEKPVKGPSGKEIFKA
jgi:hypothetical protein